MIDKGEGAGVEEIVSDDTVSDPRRKTRVTRASGGVDDPAGSGSGGPVVVEGSRSDAAAPPVASGLSGSSGARGSDASAAEVVPEDDVSSAVGGFKLMAIVKPGLASLAEKFKYADADTDSEKKTAAKFINDLNDYVKALPASGGGSRRALKRIMKKYSRRVSRSRRQRGKRVKPSAQ